MRDYAELVKALRYCSDISDFRGCLECVYEHKCREHSRDRACINQPLVMVDAADAIEELLEEKAKLENSGKLLVAAFDRLKEKVPQWVSVEDDPPKENGRYLVRYKRDVDLGDGETVHEDEIRIMRFFVGDGWRYPIICNDYVRLVNEEVTHWMPLPEPPKEVE